MVDSNTLTTSKTRRSGPEADPGASARTARRWFLITAPAFAGLLAIVGAAADPVHRQRAGALRGVRQRPRRPSVQVPGLPLLYLFWGAATLLLVGLVRQRGS